MGGSENGGVDGMKVANSSVASTLMCVLVKSVIGKYKDLICHMPKLTASKQLECFNEVITLLQNCC